MWRHCFKTGFDKKNSVFFLISFRFLIKQEIYFPFAEFDRFGMLKKKVPLIRVDRFSVKKQNEKRYREESHVIHYLLRRKHFAN